MRASLGLLALLLSLSPAHAATVINFDDLPASTGGQVTPGGVTPFVGATVPSNYSSLVTFTVANGAIYVYAEASFWQNNPAASLPNVICPAQTALASSAMCTEALRVTFADAVNAVSFWSGAWDDVGSVLTIEIYTGSNLLAGQIQITSPQRNNTQGIIDVSTLSGIANITGLRIISPSAALPAGAGDRNGLVYDNFTFTLPTVDIIDTPIVIETPEPSTALLGASALLAGWLARKRRR